MNQEIRVPSNRERIGSVADSKKESRDLRSICEQIPPDSQDKLRLGMKYYVYTPYKMVITANMLYTVIHQPRRNDGCGEIGANRIIDSVAGTAARFGARPKWAMGTVPRVG